MNGQLHEWVTEQEQDLLRAFREFQKNAPVDASFQALVLTNEEEGLLSSFRRFKTLLRKPGFFKWRTMPRQTAAAKSVLVDESKPLLIV